jgi:hypothetical protein
MNQHELKKEIKRIKNEILILNLQNEKRILIELIALRLTLYPESK